MTDTLKRIEVPFLRGTTAQNDAYLGKDGEITIDTTLRTIRIHDGIRRGGEALLRKSDLSSGGVIPTVVERADYAKRSSIASATVIYKAEAAPGTLDGARLWRIKRVTIQPGATAVKTEWANGSQEFSLSWSDRLTYNYS